MKFLVALAALVCVASAQYGGFQSTKAPYNKFPAYAPTKAPVRLVPVPTFAPKPVSPAPAPARPVAKVASSDASASVLRFDNENSPDGSYSYAVETDNGIYAQASGVPKDFGGNPPVVPVVSQGSYSFITPEGKQVVITYVADENGFQPSGDAIPTAPPVPEAILRSLALLPQAARK